MTAAEFAANARSYIGRSYSEIDCAKLVNLASNGAIKATGSNFQWRYETGDKGKISDGKPTDPYPDGNNRKSSQLEIGMGVFCHKSADTKKYPDGQGDYCHVGIVTSVSPLKITNASSEKGIVTDYTRIGTFAAWAYFTDIDYGSSSESGSEASEGSETKMLYQAKVCTQSGSLNVRQTPAKGHNIIGSLKKGAVVNVYEISGTWARISYNTVVEGWVSLSYLAKIAGTEQAADESSSTTDT